MSNTNKIRRCPRCGESNQVVSHFCLVCGSKIEESGSDRAETENNGSNAVDLNVIQTDQGASAPGVPQNDEIDEFDDVAPDDETVADTADGKLNQKTVEYEENEAVAKKSARAEKISVTRRGGEILRISPKKQKTALFLLSVLLFVSFFMPFVSVETEFNDYSSYSVSFSSYELVMLGFSSFSSYSDDELEKTDEYKTYTTLKEYADRIKTNEKISRSQEKALSRYAKSAIQLHLMSKNSDMKINLIFTAILAVLYALIVLASAISALVGLLTYSTSKVNKSFFEFGKKLTVAFFASIPFYSLLVMQTARFSYAFGINNYSSCGVSLNWNGILVVIASVTFAIGLIVKCYKRAFEKSASLQRFTERCNFCGLICVILAICSVFLPCISTETAAIANNKVKNEFYYVSADELHELSSDDLKVLKTSMSKISEDDFVKTMENVANGNIDKPMTYYTLNWVFFRYNSGMGFLYTLGGITALLSIGMMSLLTIRLADSLLNNKAVKRKKILLLLSSACAIAYFVICLMISVVGNYGLSKKAAMYSAFYVGVGPIFSLLLFAAAFVILMLRRKVKMTREFDDPDVSYAPYVI